ncbi:phosphopantetheine-binding protein, partial [Nocardia sp.]
AGPADMSTRDYWVRQLREPVRFHDCLRHVADTGVSVFLEVGPAEVLSAMVYETVTDPETVAVPALRPGLDEATSVTRAAAAAWVRGVALDWVGTYAGSGARTVDLPTYAFQREVYWAQTDRAVLTELIGAEGARLAVGAEVLGRIDTAERVGAAEPAIEVAEAERGEYTVRLVISQIREILVDLAEDDIALDATILEIGLTSLSALELRARINAAAGTSITLEDLFLHPTPRALADLLADRLWPAEPVVVGAP